MGAQVEGTSEVPRCREVLRGVQLYIHADMVGKASHKQLHLPDRVEIAHMAQHRVEAINVVLDRGRELKAAQLGKAGALDSRTEPLVAQLLQAIPWQHPLVLLEGVIPRLRRAHQVVRRQPGAIRGLRALPAEELLTLGEPVEWVDGAIISRELEFVEARMCCSMSCALISYGRRLAKVVWQLLPRKTSPQRGLGTRCRRPPRRGRLKVDDRPGEQLRSLGHDAPRWRS